MDREELFDQLLAIVERAGRLPRVQLQLKGGGFMNGTFETVKIELDHKRGQSRTVYLIGEREKRIAIDFDNIEDICFLDEQEHEDSPR